MQAENYDKLDWRIATKKVANRETNCFCVDPYCWKSHVLMLLCMVPLGLSKKNFECWPFLLNEKKGSGERTTSRETNSSCKPDDSYLGDLDFRMNDCSDNWFD